MNVHKTWTRKMWKLKSRENSSYIDSIFKDWRDFTNHHLTRRPMLSGVRGSWEKQKAVKIRRFIRWQRYWMLGWATLVDLDFLIRVCMINATIVWRCLVIWLEISHNGEDSSSLYLNLDPELQYFFINTL